MKDLLVYFPNKIANCLEKYLNKNLEEIRIRSQRPVILKFNNNEIILNIISTTEDVIHILQKVCENSIYTYQNEICQGFITIKGGHRIGIVGDTVMENCKVKNIRYISSLNFRIAKEVCGCSNKILQYVLDVENNTVFSTLIVSPPGGGKTTILRDLVRNISNGIRDLNFQGKTIGVVDERGEISSSYKGVLQNDLGIRTDVFENIPKNIGMKLLIRSMGPEIIVADEIGTSDEINVINYAICSGVKGIFTAHGSSFDDLKFNPILSRLLNSGIVKRIVFLKNKNVESVFKFTGGQEGYVRY